MSKKTKRPAPEFGNREINSRPASWQDLVILCGKCEGKLKGGFGGKGRDALRGALREALRESGRRREVRIVEADCFGICPKRAVVAMRGRDPGHLLIVPEGQPAIRILTRLGIISEPTASVPT